MELLSALCVVFVGIVCVITLIGYLCWFTECKPMIDYEDSMMIIKSLRNEPDKWEKDGFRMENVEMGVRFWSANMLGQHDIESPIAAKFHWLLLWPLELVLLKRRLGIQHAAKLITNKQAAEEFKEKVSGYKDKL